MISYSTNPNIIDKGIPGLKGWINTTTEEYEMMLKIKDGHAISPGIIRPGHDGTNPSAIDMLAAEFVAIDIDDDHYLRFTDLTQEEFIRNNALFAYTTASHTEEHQRFRVVFRLTRRVDKREYKYIATKLIERFHSDRNCKDISRIFYGNTRTKVQWMGKTMNADKFLDDALSAACKCNNTRSEEPCKWSVVDVKSMLNVIPKRMDYQDWLLVLSGIANEFDHSTAVELIEEWSPDEDKGTEVKVAHAIPTINMGAVVNIAKRYGWIAPRNNTKVTKLETLMADNYYDEFLSIYQNGFEGGDYAGIPKLDKTFRFYRKMLTIISGIPSHGKTSWLKYMMTALAVKSDWKFAIFSPEDASAAMYMSCLAEIYIGKPFEKGRKGQMTQGEMKRAYDFIRSHFYFIFPKDYDHKFSIIIDATNELIDKEGIDGLVIDPWNQISHVYGDLTEHEYIGRKLNMLKYFSREKNIHTFVVAHPRKPMMDFGDKTKKSYQVPSPYDVSGSANWYNVADNFMMVYRATDEDTGNLSNHSSIYISKVKHRYVGSTGSFSMGYDINTQRYV